MDHSYPVTQVSQPGSPCLHTYYDICPESPDGSKIVYFRFLASAIPGTGHVMVAERDGSDPAVVSEEEAGIGHVGAFAQWLTDDVICYHVGEHKQGDTVLKNLVEGTEQRLPGEMRQLNLDADRGLVQQHPLEENPHKLARQVDVVRISDGEVLNTIDVQDAWDRYEGQSELEAVDQFQIQNTKFSPDGSQFLFVFTNEVYRRVAPAPDARRNKALYLADADGANVRFLGDFLHHPIWAPDGRSVLAMDAATGAHKQDLARYPLDGNKHVVIENALGIHGSPHPDGRRMVIDAFGRPREGMCQLLMYDLETREFDEIAEFPHHELAHTTGHHPHPVWSRDAKSFYFNAMDTGIGQVYRMDVA
jgi:hypothetical protein